MSDDQEYPAPGPYSGPPPGQHPAPPPPPPGAPEPGAWGSPPQGPGHPGYPNHPAYPAYPQPGAVPPGMLGAVHKPGAFPLRPLGLGDMYDAAFRIIRFNPKATVGSAVLVAAVAMMIPLVLVAALTFTIGLTYDAAAANGDIEDVAGLVASFGAIGLGSILQAVGLIFVTGMVAHVTAAAAVGRRLSLGQAWAATAGKRWRLVGLSLLLGLILTIAMTVYVLLWILVAVTASTAVIVVWGLVTVPAFLAGLVWFWVRFYYLPVPALMLEDVGVLGALCRAHRLTSRQFWRTFGIALLTVVVVNVAGGILALPITFVGQLGVLAVDQDQALLVLVLTQGLSSVVSTAFVAPFSAAVASLQYVDQRMRKEGYDVDLMREAGVLR